ncbi:MAG: spore germination protein [Halanaerobiaceae bacterium]
MQQEISKHIEKNREYVQDKLGADESFDIVTRNFEIGEREASLIFLDGFIKDQLIIPLRSLMGLTREDISVNSVKKILNRHLPYYEVETAQDYDTIITEIMSGAQCLFLNRVDQAIIIDGRTWLTRTPEEPELEKSTRGPADGFVETMLFNVNAVRRRIRDPNFRAEVLQVGKRSKSDVALMYIKDIINPDLLQDVKSKLEGINIDGLPLGDKSVEEIITGGTLNPLPLVRYTERPDNVTAHILEGNLVLMIDNSPTALILPAPFFSHLQTLEVFRKGPVNGTYLSIIRLLALFFSVLLPAVWLLMAINPELKPEILGFIGVKEESTIGLGVQFILASLGIDLIRVASVQTPNTLATSLSLIGALLLGDFAVQVGLFSPEVILYMSVSAISNFAIPGYELALSLKLCRFFILVMTILAGIWGFGISLAVIFIWMVFTKSFGVYYLWPLIPFDYQALKSYFFRESIMDLSHIRPRAYKTRDSDRTVKKDDEEEN